MFFNILPRPYYSHFCKLVWAIRVIYQRQISQEQLTMAHKLLLEWCVEFEALYYQRKPEHLHFIRQCVHSLTHLAKETYRLGPLSRSQLRQPSNPFANLALQAQKMAHVNTLVTMWPSFEKVKQDPYGSINLGNRYILLRPADKSGPYYLSHKEEEAFNIFCSGHQESEGIDRRSVSGLSLLTHWRH